jgi:hypothetical protein
MCWIFAKILHKSHFFYKDSWSCEQSGWPPQKVQFFVACRAAKKSAIFFCKKKRKKNKNWLGPSHFSAPLGFV